MLTIEPMSGYDMKKFSEQSLAHFWHESYGNLYPRLKRLEAEGSIRGQREARAHAPDAIVYSITDSGRERFQAWLDDDPEPERIRNELLLKVFFGAQSSLATCREHLRRERAQQQRTLDRYDAIGELTATGEDRPDAPFWAMSLRRGVLLTRARIEWCDESIALIDSLDTVEEP